MGQGQSVSRGGLPSLDELGGYNRPPVMLKDELETKMQWMGASLGADASRYQQSMETGGNKQRMMLGMSGPLSKTQSRRIKFDPFFGHGDNRSSELSKINEQRKSSLTDPNSNSPSPKGARLSFQGAGKEEDEASPRARSARISFGGGGDSSSRDDSPLKPIPTKMLSPSNFGLEAQKSAPSLYEGGSRYLKEEDSTQSLRSNSARIRVSKLPSLPAVFRASDNGQSSPAEASSPASSALPGLSSQRRAKIKPPLPSLLENLDHLAAQPSQLSRLKRSENRSSDPGHRPLTNDAKPLSSQQPNLARKSLDTSPPLAEWKPVEHSAGSFKRFPTEAETEGGTILFPKMGPRHRERTERTSAPLPMKSSILSFSRKSREAREVPASSSLGDSSDNRLAARNAARRLALLGWRPSKTVAQTIEEEKYLHWRVRVKNAKMRLYWYLRGYMAWFSILRKIRKGYADAFNVEDIPLYLQTILGKMKGPFLSAMASSEANQLTVIANRVNARWIEDHDSGHPTAYPATPTTPSSSTSSTSFLPSLTPLQSTQTQGDQESSNTDNEPGWSGGWSAPTVINTNFLNFEGANPAHQERALVETMARGAIACQLFYLGEQVAQEKMGEKKKAAIEIDLWAEVASLDPNKLPSGTRRLEGLTLLDRSVLQVLSSVEKIAKTASVVANFHLIICVDSESTSFVVEQIALKSHWGLDPSNVFVVSIAAFPGMIWDSKAKKIALKYLSDDVPYMCAGSGFALLSMAWPSESFRVQGGQRVYLSGSAFSSLIADNVEYIYSISLSDLENLNPATSLDVTFLSPALYMMRSHHDAQIAVEVVQSPSDSILRQQGNIVLAGAPSPSIFCSVLSRTDLLTQPTRALIDRMAMKTSCTGRYLIKVKEIVKLIKGPRSFHPDLMVTTESGQISAYLSLDMVNLTSVDSSRQIISRCVAVAGKSSGRDPESRFISKDALLAAVPHLLAQENQAAFKKLAAPLIKLNQESPVMTMNLMSSESQELEEPPVKRKGCKILLLVKDSGVCRQSFRLCQSLIGQEEGDGLVIMTLKEPTSHGIEEGQKLLRTFSHITTDHLTTRIVGELLSDRLVESLVTAIEKVNADLVVLGSETLANSGSLSFNSATSTCYALAKAPLLQSILIVKTNSAGGLFSLSEDSLAGEAGPLKVAMEVVPSISTLNWTLQRCNARRDSLALFRRQPPSRPGQGQDEINAAKKHSERLLATFENEVLKRRFKMTRKLFLSFDGGPLAQEQALKNFVLNERCDLVVLAGGARGSPPHILDLLLGCKANVMIQRLSYQDLGSGSARIKRPHI